MTHEDRYACDYNSKHAITLSINNLLGYGSIEWMFEMINFDIRRAVFEFADIEIKLVRVYMLLPPYVCLSLFERV